MNLVELYTGADCHLCDVAKEMLLKVQKAYPFELRVMTIREGEDRYEEFKERIPVVFINGTFAFQYRVPEKELVKKLTASR